MDLNQIMQLMNDPKARQLLQGLLGQLTSKQGGNANLTGLLSQLQGGGLDQQVKSWLGSGTNQPVTGEQVQSALGSDTVSQVATSAGTTPQQAADGLAQVLPKLVDTASPEGQLADPKSLQDALSKLLQPTATGSGSGTS
jgi:uncharacterized protein YidB (DUF937 family)